MDRQDLPLRDQVTLLEHALHETEGQLGEARREAAEARAELEGAKLLTLRDARLRAGLSLRELARRVPQLAPGKPSDAMVVLGEIERGKRPIGVHRAALEAEVGPIASAAAIPDGADVDGAKVNAQLIAELDEVERERARVDQASEAITAGARLALRRPSEAVGTRWIEAADGDLALAITAKTRWLERMIAEGDVELRATVGRLVEEMRAAERADQADVDLWAEQLARALDDCSSGPPPDELIEASAIDECVAEGLSLAAADDERERAAMSPAPSDAEDE